LTNEHIGGLSGLYDKAKAADDYIPGNYAGSLLTMKSKSGKANSLRYVKVLY
jgi:urea-proton symporter